MSLKPRNKLQPPFRPQDLLSLPRFISYCRDEGVETSEWRLEYYDKENLLLPAMRINRGIVEYRKVLLERGGRPEWRFVCRDGLDRKQYKKVDRRSYYDYGAIGQMGGGWLDEYKKRRLVEYPAETEFREWETYKEVVPETSASPYVTEIPRPCYEIFYSRLQIFPLREIQDRLVFHLIDGDLFASDEDWIQGGKNVRARFAGAREILQRRVLRYCETFALLHRILDLLAERSLEADREYRREFAVYGPEYARDAVRFALRDRRASIDWQDEVEMPGKARAILRKTGLSPKEIEERREGFAYLGFIVDPMRGSSICFSRAIRRRLETSSGQFKFAFHCYAIANRLEWFLRMVGEHPPTLEKLNGGIDRLKFCAVCQRPFIPKKRSGVTCGDKGCIAAHRKGLRAEWKRRRRKKV